MAFPGRLAFRYDRLGVVSQSKSPSLSNLSLRSLLRAYTTTKEEAFSAPIAFLDVLAFYEGKNGELLPSTKLHYLLG